MTAPDDPTPAQPPDRDRYLGPYLRAVNTHGAAFESTLWASKPMQTKRFDILAHTLDPTDRTILDAGSGLADLPAHLVERGIHFDRCIALEAVEELHRHAEQRRIPRTECHLADFAADPDAFRPFAPDIVYFSGSLNSFPQEHALPILQRAYDAARIGIAFNFLSTRHHKRNPPDPAPAVRYDPLHILEWALKATPNVRFRQDYFEGHDATVAMTRPEN